MTFESEEIISISLSLSALLISLTALIYTIRTYLLKRGLNIRSSFSIGSSVSCKDQYISHILLENQKDRSVAIYQIYLKVAHSYYVLIEDFEDKPLILQAFEVYRKDFDPIEMYIINMNRIDLNDLLADRKVKKDLLLATSEGKYKAKSHIKFWNPISMFFKNQLTANIRIHRLSFKGSSYGENTKYIVVFKTSDDHEEVVPIYPRDYEIKKFRNFQLTKDSLSSKEKLEEYIFDKLADIKSECSNIIVYDYGKWQNEFKGRAYTNTLKASKINWFIYYVIGPFITRSRNRERKRKNKKLKIERNKN